MPVSTLEESQVVSLLRATEIFAKLRPEHVQPIARACRVVKHEPQTPIVRQGDPGNELFILAAGQVAVVLEDRHAGFEQAVLKLGPGQSFGEISLLNESPRSATVKAIEPTVCIALAKKSFDSLLRQIPELGLEISRYLSARLHQQCQLTGFRFIGEEELVHDPELHKLFALDTLEDAQAVPLQLEDGILTVALTRPNSFKHLKALREEVPGLAIEPVACTWDDYESFHTKYRSAPKRALPTLSDFAPDEPLSLSSGEQLSTQLSALFREILGRGVKQTVLDIKGGVALVYDTDSPATPLLRIGKAETLEAQLDTAFFSRGNNPYLGEGVLAATQSLMKVELSRLQTLAGVRYSVKLVDPEEKLPSLQRLLPTEHLRESLLKVLWEDSGVVLISGSPRCGKTTTAYSILERLSQRRDFGNVITIEDEPHLRLEAVSQVKKVREWRPLLQAALAQEPALLFLDDVARSDIPEFLNLCEPGRRVMFACSLTDPLESLREQEREREHRIDITKINGVLHQRWLPRQCPSCRAEYQPSQTLLRSLVQADLALENQLHFTSEGCSQCRGSGYSGRCHVFEFLILNSFLREMIEAGRPAAAIRTAAAKSGRTIPAASMAKHLLKQGDLSATDALKHFGGRRA
jgi:cyclic nucleotide-binding protein/type II/IV secretion system protein/type II secretion system (T2SS) protein E